ncbi:MAG TPA: AMP-dependent synthetase, partial [Acidimicrobiaceae bacterium]|nr:AMP-dependent synthetase [Acidimicrobiaceae bacterium]
MNLMMLLEMAAGGLGDRVAVGSLDDGLTYRQLYDRAHGAANRYRAAGVESAVVCDESSPALPIALFGSAWAGIPYVPLNYRLPSDDLLALAERAGSAVAIADESNLERLGGLPGVSSVSAEAFSADPAAGTDGHASPGDWNMDPDDLAVLLFTSGTTGSPKSAVLRHKHLVSYILGSVEFMGAGEDEATLVSVPPYHIAGVASMLSSV